MSVASSCQAVEPEVDHWVKESWLPMPVLLAGVLREHQEGGALKSHTNCYEYLERESGEFSILMTFDLHQKVSWDAEKTMKNRIHHS